MRSVVSAASPADGLAALARDSVDLVIQDMNFRREATSGEEGIALFHEIRAGYPQVPIILLTAWTHLETAVELVRAGAADYIAKPWDDARLLTSVRNLLDLRSARAEAEELRARTAARRATRSPTRFDLRGIVYESEAMHTLVCHGDAGGARGRAGADHRVRTAPARRCWRTSCRPTPRAPTALLQGESRGAAQRADRGGAFRHRGRRLHRRARAHRAASRRPMAARCFSMSSGTLSGSGQAKLLRVLQTGEFERLGSNITRRTRVRVIAATNTNLRQAIRDGTFREDLFYRLNVIELEVPPLAERREDILALAQHFLEPGFTLAPAAEEALAPLPLAGQCARAAEHHPPRLPAVGRATPSVRPPSTCRSPRQRRPASRASTARRSSRRWSARTA